MAVNRVLTAAATGYTTRYRTCLLSDEFSLQTVLKCSSLSIKTEVHLYEALMMYVLFYGAETWTLLAANMNTLEGFHNEVSAHIIII